MKGKGKYILLLLFCGWFMSLIKHFWIIPTVGEDNDISGFEFRIKF